MSFLRKRYKIRKSTKEGGHQISIPPGWMENRDVEEVEVLYDSLAVVIVAPGVKINEKVLEGAFEQPK